MRQIEAFEVALYWSEHDRLAWQSVRSDLVYDEGFQGEFVGFVRAGFYLGIVADNLPRPALSEVTA